MADLTTAPPACKGCSRLPCGARDGRSSPQNRQFVAFAFTLVIDGRHLIQAAFVLAVAAPYGTMTGIAQHAMTHVARWLLKLAPAPTRRQLDQIAGGCLTRVQTNGC